MHVKPIQALFRDENGSILVVSLLIILAASVMGASLSMLSSTDLKISGNQRLSTEALSVAEAGLSEAIHRLMLPNPTVETVAGWTGNIAISDSEPYDPNWEAQIYMTDPGSAPGGGGSVVTTGTIQPTNVPYMQYSSANGGDDLLTIEHKWEDRNGDNNRDADEVVLYDPEQVPPENFVTGFPVEIVTVTGRRANARRTVQAEVTRRTLLARTLGALYIDKSITVGGTPNLCGHNHDINTPVGTVPNGCFAWHEATGHLPGITTTGGEVDIQSPAVDLLGQPAPTDTASTNPFYTLAETLGISQAEVDQMLRNADHTSIVNPLRGITYIQGDVALNANIVGEGLVYVTGDLMVNGDMVYRGLIYAEGDVRFTGSGWILGSMIVSGTADYQASVGSATILYSKEAIQQLIGLYMPAIVLSWREI